MEKLIAFLLDWTKEFVRNKNIMTKSLVSIEENGTELIAKHKDKDHHFLIIPSLNSFADALSDLGKSPDMHLSVVTFNSSKAFKALMDNWKELAKHRNFSVYFVNPFSQLDKRWIINPCTHSKICDEDSLELGLKAMFDTVEPITEEEAKRKV